MALVVAAALIFGAGLPIVFAFGIRSLAPAGVNADGTAQRNPASTALGYLFLGLVVVAVVVGILFIAKDFIAHTFDISLFGAK